MVSEIKRAKGLFVSMAKQLKQITHVAIMLDDRVMIEAGGGDSAVINIDIAKEGQL